MGHPSIEPSTINSPLSSFPWSCLEQIPGGTAFHTTWKHHAGPDFDLLKSLFLKPASRKPSSEVPCPWHCGCHHKVVPHDNGTLHGVCQCERPNCQTYTVLDYERIQLELDWQKLAHTLSKVFQLQPRLNKLGIYHALQIGTWSSDAIPAILTICSSKPEFSDRVARLTTQIGKPFLLFAPTRRFFTEAANELITNLGGGFFALSEHLSRAESGDLVCAKPPGEIFAHITPSNPDLTDEDRARRVFVVLQEEDRRSRAGWPSLSAIFHFYCVDQLSAREIARQCKCGLGVVSKRLKRLRLLTGQSPEKLRRISGLFTKLERDFGDAQSDYQRRKYLED